MSAIRSKNNQTEMLLRKALFRLGLRYRVHVKNVVGKPDIVFARIKLAIFVDGDYWHARHLRESKPRPRFDRLHEPSQQYWYKKMVTRVERDDEVNRTLAQSGWTVLRYWESDLRKNIDGVASEIQELVSALRSGFDE